MAEDEEEPEEEPLIPKPITDKVKAGYHFITDYGSEATRGVLKNNPLFVLLLGFCPALAVTTTLDNAIAMGAAFAVVFVASATLISTIGEQAPKDYKKILYITIVAIFTTAVSIIMQRDYPNHLENLSIYFPLIAVNCIILGRVQYHSNQTSPPRAFLDALGLSAGFSIILIVISSIRELLGTTQLTLNSEILFQITHPIPFFLLAPGALLTIALLIALTNITNTGIQKLQQILKERKEKKEAERKKLEEQKKKEEEEEGEKK